MLIRRQQKEEWSNREREPSSAGGPRVSRPTFSLSKNRCAIWRAAGAYIHVIYNPENEAWNIIINYQIKYVLGIREREWEYVFRKWNLRA